MLECCKYCCYSPASCEQFHYMRCVERFNKLRTAGVKFDTPFNVFYTLDKDRVKNKNESRD